MGVKITSKNQSGGITAQNVSLGSEQVNSSPVVKKDGGLISWRIIVGAVGFLASILGILQYFDISIWGN
jgi:hypothetical protein